MTQPRIEVALHGSYFGYNFGDILLLHLYGRWIREQVGDVSVSLPFASEHVGQLIGADHTGWRRLIHARSLIYAGGGYFGESPNRPTAWGYRNVARHFPPALGMKLRKRPYAVIGVGVGPVTNVFARQVLMRVCADAAMLSVRDNESRDYLLEYGVDRPDILVTADAALTVEAADIPRPSLNGARALLGNSRGHVNVGLHLAVPAGYEERALGVVMGLRDVLKGNPSVRVIVFSDSLSGANPVGKLPHAVRILSSEFPDRCIFVDKKDPWDLVALLSVLDLVVTTKLHVGIVSVALATPVLSFPYHPKVTRFYEQIQAVDRCNPLSTVDRAKVSSLVKTQLEELRKTGKRSILPATIRQKALANKDALGEFVRTTLF